MPTGSSANPLAQFIPFIFIFLIFYFLIIRPEKKKKNQIKDMVNNLKKNDQVVTAGGIHGSVAIVKDKTIVLRLDDNVRVEFDKEAISTLISKSKS